ncbi:hypothetical protein [Salininema proteolyticum]|uniref:Uncharacterized protein n=1 Tax=Salininema proteolyticum TaxID=1607685 RepID=A0ABV8TTQ4_9ACTN
MSQPNPAQTVLNWAPKSSNDEFTREDAHRLIEDAIRAIERTTHKGSIRKHLRLLREGLDRACQAEGEAAPELLTLLRAFIRKLHASNQGRESQPRIVEDLAAVAAHLYRAGPTEDELMGALDRDEYSIETCVTASVHVAGGRYDP